MKRRCRSLLGAQTPSLGEKNIPPDRSLPKLVPVLVAFNALSPTLKNIFPLMFESLRTFLWPVAVAAVDDGNLNQKMPHGGWHEDRKTAKQYRNCLYQHLVEGGPLAFRNSLSAGDLSVVGRHTHDEQPSRWPAAAEAPQHRGMALC
jgi:hypothetical protein